MPYLKKLLGLLFFPVLAMLGGCDWVLMRPSGDIAMQQRDLILTSTVLMLLVIVPVIVLTFVFAWRYRKSNNRSDYDPEWHHSTQLELVIWAVPLVIIIILGAITWISTHKLDPYRPLERIDAQRTMPAGTKPLVVEVVALDWKWLFIYPEQGIAMVNEMAAPVDRPIQFKITASSVMNSFFIPAMAGQIYAMPGMQTQLHAIINKPGEFEGLSANYSGAGFSGMRFKFHGLNDGDFEQWVKKVKSSSRSLSRDTYLQLEKPSERNPVQHYAKVAPDLYEAILNRCVENNKMCMHDMMAIDASGGLGKPGTINIASLDEATRARLGLNDQPTRNYVGAMCSPGNPLGLQLPVTEPATSPI
ncbi:cytochrome o ubiquinol oxidase subunit 2 [Polaromonas sp. OV174]|uniref:ubiquinol oxidase subunit II n=1 Tax=Polaromonas sp. OV174 TaxID=1855300 RepID=UPI0008E0DB5E|nr:ubiquinol oxidase subunit II [Polaromonas sp. OV174]SFC40240.1 cytochrome o ubiquinol oxidase subunit 2 [Polaromonas sp. OV174]